MKTKTVSRKGKRLINVDHCIEHPDRPVESWHHIIPASLGGKYTIPLCAECHSLTHYSDKEHFQNHSNLIKFGLDKAKKKGVKIGRPTVIDEAKKAEIKKLRSEGYSIRGISQMSGVGRSTVERVIKNIK